MNKTRKTTYHVESKEVVDVQTGEIGTVETVKRQKITIESEPFYMVFIDYIAPLFNLSNSTAKSVLSWMCSHATFNTGKISLSSNDRETIRKELGISNASLSIVLKELKNKNLIDGDKGTYTINPQIFWKGDLISRNALLNTKEIQIAFSINIGDIGLKEK